MKLIQPVVGDAELKSIEAVLRSGWLTMGSQVRAFEKIVAQRHQVPYALAVNSCTSALHVAMLALKIGPGDEVIVPSFTWITSASAVEYVGARPVFVDVSPTTYNLDVSKVEAAITPRTKAIMIVHLFGLSADMNPLIKIAKQHGLYLVEDAACAIGSTYNGQPVGGIGDIGCFSFHPRKVITTGEGGMLVTKNENLNSIMRGCRSHGASYEPFHPDEPVGPWTMAEFDMLGFNFRMSDIQAAIGFEQMRRLDEIVQERRRIASGYVERLKGAECIALPPSPSVEKGHTYQSFVIRVMSGGRQKRNKIMSALNDQEIETRPGTHAVHCLGFYRKKYHLKKDDLPVSAYLADDTITLPVFSGMTDSEIDLVCSIVIENSKG